MARRPEEALVLYQFEGCPMCRRVRLAIADLGLPTEIRPCPKGGTRYRPEAAALSGKTQFPFLVDPNTGVSMLESVDIVAYLYATYGEGAPPAWLFGPRFVAGTVLAAVRSDPEDAERLALCRSETAYLWDPGARGSAARIRGPGRAARRSPATRTGAPAAAAR